MQGKTAHRNGVYINVHEYSSTVLTMQLSSLVEFMDKSKWLGSKVVMHGTANPVFGSSILPLASTLLLVFKRL